MRPWLDPEGARALASATHLARLQYLDLGHNLLGVDGARALADAAHFARLRHLCVQANQLGPDGARALAVAPWLPALERLRLAPSDKVARGLDDLRGVAPALEIVGLERSGT